MLNAVIVDDSSIDILLLKSIVEDYLPNNISIHTYTESTMAKKYLDNNVVTLLVTDIEMPGMDGYELIEHCKKNNKDTIIIAVSGSNFEHNATNTILYAAEKVGADYVVSKSNLYDDLGGLLDNLTLSKMT